MNQPDQNDRPRDWPWLAILLLVAVMVLLTLLVLLTMRNAAQFG